MAKKEENLLLLIILVSNIPTHVHKDFKLLRGNLLKHSFNQY